MAYQMTKFLHSMILTELEDAVGKENCSTRQIDKMTHSVDYYWLSRMWADRGERMPEADFIVCPKDATEVSKVMKMDIMRDSTRAALHPLNLIYPHCCKMGTTFSR